MLLVSARPHPNFIKWVGEIFLDKEGFVIGNLRGIKDPNNLQGTCLSDISFRKDVDGMEQLRTFLINSHYEEHGKKIDTLLEKVSRYISRTGLNEIYEDYCRTSYMQACFRRAILSNNRVTRKDFDMYEITKDYIDFCKGSSFSSLDVDGGTLAAYLVFSFTNHYLKGRSKKVFDTINERGNIISHGDSDLDLSSLVNYDLNEGEHHSFKTGFDFPRDVKSIHRLNNDLFVSRKESSGCMISDVLTLYKNYKSKSFEEPLKKEIMSTFCGNNKGNITKSFLQTNEYFIKIDLENLDADGDYKRNTLKSRSECCYKVFDKFSSNIGVTELLNIVKIFISKDQKDYSDKNTGCLFSLTNLDFTNPNADSIDVTIQNPNNRNYVKDLIEGFLSFNRFLRYCRSENIDINSVPVKIFKTDEYYKRFDTLEDCLACFSHTELLINEANLSTSDPSKPKEILNNDDTYAYLDSLIYKKKDFSFKILVKDLKKLEQDNQDKSYAQAAIEDLNSRYDEGIKKFSILVDLMNKLCSKVEGDIAEKALKVDEFVNNYEQKDALLENFVSEIGERELNNSIIKNDLTKLLNGEFGLRSMPFTDILRYYDIRMILIDNLKAILNLVGQDDLELLRVISGKKFSTIPKGIKGLKDLKIYGDDYSYLRKFLCVLSSGIESYQAYKDDLLQRCAFLYSLCATEPGIDEYIDFCNNFIKNTIKRFEDDGVDTQDRVFINDRIIERSNYIYETREPNKLTSVYARISTTCTSSDYGIFYKDGKPFLVEVGGAKAYVHDYGYIIFCSDLKIEELRDDYF